MLAIQVPDFNFAGFYYPEILVALETYLEVNAPELTSQADEEPHIQLMRAFSLVGHLNNTRLDIVGNELLVDSLSLRDSMARVFKLIGVKLKSATPATVTEVIELSSIPTVDEASYVPAYSQFQTERETADDTNVVFEATSNKARDRGDRLSHVFTETRIQDGIDGDVSTSLPNRFTSSSATFTSADVGRTLQIYSSTNGNQGEYEIAAFIDANTVDVSDGSFTTETDMSWVIFEFSSDNATEANDDLLTFSPFPVSAHTDTPYLLYLAHNNLQWDQVDISFDTPSGVSSVAILEYYDPTYSSDYPSYVTEVSGTLRIGIDSIAKTSAQRGGMAVKVTYNPTGASEWCYSSWDLTNKNNILTKGLLGQSVVDTDPLQYTIHSDWIPVSDYDDGTNGLTGDGEITFRWPMDTLRKWQKTIVNGEEAYWARIRVVDKIAPIDTVIINRIRIDQGKEYFPFEIVQGTTILNEVIGSSNGLENQSMSTDFGPVFDGSWILRIDETGGGTWVEWVAKDNLLRSSATDRHYKWGYNSNGTLKITFGNNENGRIPPLGVDNVRLDEYRIGGDEDGNVGSYKIVDNVDGVPYVSEVGNPMPASGWKIKEAGDSVDLERMKDAGPASIRNNGKAAASPDIASIAVNEYKDSDGSSVVARAYSVEEAYGPKTVQLVVVGTGGNFLDDGQINEIETYYNGDRYSYPPEYGVLAMNHELTAVNYDPKSVDVTIQVIGKGITAVQVKNAITAYLHPLAKDSEGNYRHQFGGKVAVVMLDCAISDISNKITNIIRTTPASDVTLGPRQLPNAGAINVIVSETE